MLSTLRTAPHHILRGLTSLPRLGSHPGNFILPLNVGLAGTGAGAIGGPNAAMACALAAIMLLAPVHLFGAYNRALSSDAWRRRDIANDLVRTWILAHNLSAQDRVKIAFQVVFRDGRTHLHVSHDATPGGSDLPPRLTERVEDILEIM